MEVIRIPQVSLVDATGRRIGVYTDDPDWWQQLKLKHKNVQLRQIKEREMDAISIAGSEHQMGSKVKLVKEAIEDKRKSRADILAEPEAKAKAAPPKPEEHNDQCNIIGETQLHIAIMYSDFETIKFLIEVKGFDVNQRSASGKFIGGFNSKTTAGLIQQSKYEGLAYYGEYPLAFAACFANKEIYDYLIDHGADPNLQDTYGNTVLHVLVINNKLDMFQYATNHPQKKALMTIKNSQDLTPVNLAAKLGRKDLFSKMLELRNMEIWRYSNITCSTYPLEGLDTVDAQGKIAWNAALSYIVNGDTEEHLDMLEIGVVKRLLEDKWSTYVQKRLFQRLILSTIHLICLSIAVYTRAGDYLNLSIWPPTNGSTWVRYITEIAVVVGCMIVLFLSAQEIYGQGFIYFLKNLKGEPANLFYQIFCILVLVAVPFRFVTFDSSSTVTPRSVEDTLVILAIPCGWVHLLFYARVVTVTGPFVVMIYKMIVGDILTFASIYGFLLLGFSLGFYYLYKNVASTVTSMNSYPEALMISFQMTLGEFKARLPEFELIYYADFAKVVFVGFMIFMHILLLNMLIAMMGNTYHQIIKKSEKEWRKQWAHIVILLERSFSQQDLRKFQDQYCIKLPSRDPTKKDDIVALMVIKKAPKTKAFQKTACLKNWKKFSRNVLAQLKEHKCTGVKLLEIWQNKDKKVIKQKKEKKEFSWSDFENRKRPAAAPPAIQVQMKDTKNEKAPPKTDLFGMKKLSETKIEQEIKPSTSSHASTSSSSAASSSSSSSSANSRVNSASVSSQLQSSSSNNISTNPTSGALVVTRNTQKKTFFPNQTSKIYPVTTSASSVNPEVADHSDDDSGRRLDLGGAGGDAAKKSSMRRPIYPRFPLLIQTELSDLDLKNNDSSSDLSSVVNGEDSDESKKKIK